MTSQDHTQTVGGVRDLADLLARVSAATGPDRELDARLMIAMDWRPDWLVKSQGEMWLDMKSGLNEPVIRFRDSRMKRSTGNPPAGPYPAPTASLDAALALVERAAPTWTVDLTIYRTNGGEFLPHSRARLFCPYGEIVEHRADAPTAPLALVAALLKALIAQAASPTGGQLGPGLTPENPSRTT